MKKLFSTPEYSERTRRLHKKYLRVLRHGKAKYRLPEPIPTGKKQKGFKIMVPSVFSIADNADSMLAFFSQVHAKVKTGTPIFFDMSHVTVLTTDSILYMLSVFHYYDRALFFRHFMGNLPADEYCRELIVSSGFFDHVQHSGYQKRRRDILSIKTDQFVQGKTASQVVTFAIDKLNQTKGSNSKSIYATLIECMANTRHHAYIPSTRHYPRWWLMALHNEQNNRINFTFLDNGVGIPVTMKKNFTERFLDPLLNTRNDAELILSALRGEFRTQTKQRWRGRGLPRIYDFAKRQYIDNFVIVSNNGYVNASKSIATKLPLKFHGTMLSWDFI